MPNGSLGAAYLEGQGHGVGVGVGVGVGIEASVTIGSLLRTVDSSLYPVNGASVIEAAICIERQASIVAAGTTLVSVIIGSLPICIIGLCLTGFSYGSCPTMVSAFVSSFYGQKHFATNFSIMNCNLLFASFIATACSKLYVTYDGYTVPFVLLLNFSG